MLRKSRRLSILLTAVVIVALIPSLFLFQVTLSTPVDFDAGEGFVTYPISQFLSLQQIYSDLHREVFFYPSIYPPFHFLTAQVVSTTWSLPGVLAGRWVSFVAALFGSWALFLIARSLGANRILALVFGVLPFVLNPLGNFITLNQPDVPAAVLSAWGVLNLINYRPDGQNPWVNLIISSVLLTLAVFFQQRTVVVFLPAIIFLALRSSTGSRRKDLLVFCGISLVIAGLVVGFLHWRTAGNIWNYVLVLPSGHPLYFEFSLKVFLQAFVLWGGFYGLSVVLISYTNLGLSFLPFVWLPVVFNVYLCANIGASTNYFLLPTLLSLPVVAAGLSHKGLPDKLRFVTLAVVLIGILSHAGWNYFHELPQIRSLAERRSNGSNKLQHRDRKLYVNGYYSSLMDSGGTIHFTGFPFWITKYSFPSVYRKHRKLLRQRIRHGYYDIIILGSNALFPMSNSYLETYYEKLSRNEPVSRAYGRVFVKSGAQLTSG